MVPRRVFGLAMPLVFAGAALFDFRQPSRPRANPAHRIEAALPMPAADAALLYRACGDCHSDETRWPWYSHLRPVSRLMVHDVESARRALNLSEWTTGAGSRTGAAIGILLGACEDLKMQRMPPRAYQLVHPEARVSAAETAQFCAWTQQESLQLQQFRRRQFSRAAHAFNTP